MFIHQITIKECRIVKHIEQSKQPGIDEGKTRIGERVKAVGVIKPTLIFTMRALNLAVMTGRIGADEFQFFLRMLIRMTVGALGLTGQRFHTAVPVDLPEIDV